MNLYEIPYKVVVSMPQCGDRRGRLFDTMGRFGFGDLVWVKPVPISEIDISQYSHLPPKTYPYISQILTLKGILSEAKRRGASSFWHLEDDAKFHPQFHDRSRRLRVPNNWRFLYLGGAYYQSAVRINEGVVGSNRLLDLHSIIVASEMFDLLDAAFDAALKDTGRKEIFADVIIAGFHKKFPAYLCRPNLVWQSTHYSDLKGSHYSSYTPEGEQWRKGWEMSPAAVYTFWSRDPMHKEKWPNTEAFLECFQQSVHRARQHFNRVVLYTDTPGRALLGGIHFDEVLVTLDVLQGDSPIGYEAYLDTFAHLTEPFVHLEPGIFWDKGIRVDHAAVILPEGRMSAAERKAASNWLRSLAWIPQFIRDALEKGGRIPMADTGIFGGKDFEFLKWYAQIGLEILRRYENAPAMAKIDRSTERVAFRALAQLVLSICVQYRNKEIKLLPESNSRKADGTQSGVFTRLSASNVNVPQIIQQNREAGLRLVPSSPYIRHAKRGYGWHPDLQNVRYRVVLHKGSRESAEPYLSKIAGLLGLPFEMQGVEKNTPHPEDAMRQALVEILRKAKTERADQCLIITHGAEFHPQFHARVHRLQVPYDWQFIYLGGSSRQEEEWVARGLVKSSSVQRLDAVILRAEAMQGLEKTLLDPLVEGETCQEKMARLQSNLATYLCRPQLIFTSPDSFQAESSYEMEIPTAETIPAAQTADALNGA